MSRRARFVVSFFRPLDRSWKATVTIDRGSLVFGVRLFRRRALYELPLETVASMVAGTVIKANATAKLAAKREAAKQRRQARRR